MNYQPPILQPKASKAYQNTASFSISCLNKLFEKKEWVEGAHRNTFIFIYYNCYKVIYGAQAAYQKINELNNQMAEPLNIRDINWLCVHSDDVISNNSGVRGGALAYKPSNIPIKLELDDELARECGFFYNEEKKKKRFSQKEEDRERDELIAELYLRYKYNVQDISFALKDKGFKKVSGGTVRNRIKSLKLEAYGTFEEFKSKHLSFFNKKCELMYERYIQSKSNVNEAEQDDIVRRVINSSSNYMILGEAGTGKSTLINRIINESNKRIAVCSFTGIASEQLQKARTIHSLFRLPPNDIYTSDMAKAVSSLRKIDTLIVDEISLVKIDLFDLIIKSLHLTEAKFNHKIQVIIAGDLSQLAPFVTSDSKKEFERLFQKRIYMYESDLFEQEHFERIVLKKIFRQKEPVFMDILRRVRFCESYVLDELYTKFDLFEHKEGIYLCARNTDVDRINAERTAELAYKASDKAIFVTEKGKTLLFAGMPIMTTVNRADFKNGLMGVIESTHKGKYLTVKFKSQCI